MEINTLTNFILDYQDEEDPEEKEAMFKWFINYFWSGGKRIRKLTCHEKFTVIESRLPNNQILIDLLNHYSDLEYVKYQTTSIADERWWKEHLRKLCNSFYARYCLEDCIFTDIYWKLMSLPRLLYYQVCDNHDEEFQQSVINQLIDLDERIEEARCNANRGKFDIPFSEFKKVVNESWRYIFDHYVEYSEYIKVHGENISSEAADMFNEDHYTYAYAAKTIRSNLLQWMYRKSNYKPVPKKYVKKLDRHKFRYKVAAEPKTVSCMDCGRPVLSRSHNRNIRCPDCKKLKQKQVNYEARMRRKMQKMDENIT